MLGRVFQRFVQRSPISVMVRGTLERVLGAEQLNQFYERTAKNQYTRELLFSTVYELMSDVVFRHQPSVRAAYQAQARELETSLASVYNKLRGYPETFSHCRNEIKQPPCGNETRGDRRERVC
jgi:hypothetical protein